MWDYIYDSVTNYTIELLNSNLVGPNFNYIAKERWAKWKERVNETQSEYIDRILLFELSKEHKDTIYFLNLEILLGYTDYTPHSHTEIIFKLAQKLMVHR